MGGNTSALPRTPPDFKYFCLTFRIWDKIKLLHADQGVIGVVRNAIHHTWPPGLQAESVDMGAYEFKFSGNPFTKNTSKEEAIAIKRFCCKLLSDLRTIGWCLSVSSDLSRTQDLTTWFFEQRPPETTPARVCCVSLSSQDKLQLINAPDYMDDLLKDAVSSSYGYGIQSDAKVGKDYVIKLNGYPWHTSSFEEGVHARRALLQIFRAFDSQRYTLIGTANLKGTADTLFFESEPDPNPAETQFMMLSLNSNDRIRLIDANQDAIDTVRQCIHQYWGAGLQDQRDHLSSLNCFEFKLSGYPWNSSGYEAVSSRLLITVILQSLVARGWAVSSALDISRRVNDKAVIVLRSVPSASLAHFCLSPNDVDKLRLINAPQNIIDLAVRVIRGNWPYGVQKEGPNSGSYEWKLGGQPWSAHSGNDYAHARHLLCLLITEFGYLGWRVVCSADVSAKYVHQQNGPDYPIDVHSWFFAQTSGPGTGSLINSMSLPDHSFSNMPPPPAMPSTPSMHGFKH